MWQRKRKCSDDSEEEKDINTIPKIKRQSNNAIPIAPLTKFETGVYSVTFFRPLNHSSYFII